MDLPAACQRLLHRIGRVLEQLSDCELSTPATTLNGATIGQHYRHALEFFQCLMQGAAEGRVCYDNRPHSRQLEQSKELLSTLLSDIRDFVGRADLQQSLVLQLDYSPGHPEVLAVPTNMAREIVYNIEHIVHHMALAKIGIREVCPHIALPADFGVAVSTRKYLQQQAAGH